MNGTIMKIQVSAPSACQVDDGDVSGGPRTLTAMVDSGALISRISIEAAKRLSLQQISSMKIRRIGGTLEAPIYTDVPVYAVAISIPQFSVTIDLIQIAGSEDVLPDGVDMLIGLDILRTREGGWL